ncbi:Urb2 domain-containing protein [Phyllobacterium lublinensis]|uniref:Urb2 domain-containing protein n=1 Tax=Phyllobacterium lublinensis TaxID=2875708 RepID=UPI001CCD4225|nr:Urb2 domain-containing protein [Phyllobacterium sp. 2063]MBZ9653816.1 Urb2 domain-containing protein [Phyllobacterium sp. 2063]
MSEKKEVDVNAMPLSAAELRQEVIRREMEEMEKQAKAKSVQEQKLANFAADFLKNHVSEADIQTVRRTVAAAVQNGKFEAMVYSFSSDLCSDSGRAINSGDKNWPDTLQGKAKEFYDRYQKFGKPQGYRLKAMIISFPGGMPGDVGFFLNWGSDIGA